MQWNLNLIKKIKNEREKVFCKFFFLTWFWVLFTNYYALAIPRDFQDFESFSKTRNISSLYTSMKVENFDPVTWFYDTILGITFAYPWGTIWQAPCPVLWKQLHAQPSWSSSSSSFIAATTATTSHCYHQPPPWLHLKLFLVLTS